MDPEQRNALNEVQFNSVLAPDDVWSRLDHHVDGLHVEAVRHLERAVATAARKPGANPLGVVLQGERGVGKTHMLGWLRQRVQREGGAFFLLKTLDKRSFWEGAVQGVLGSKLLTRDGGQLTTLLDRLADRTGCPGEVRMRLRGTLPVRRQDVDLLVERLRELAPEVVSNCQDTLRALVLHRAARDEVNRVGHGFLVLEDGITEAEREQWGFRARGRPAQLVFGDLSRVFALTGPVVVAVDQVDGVFSQAPGESDRHALADGLAHGLMALREEATRTVIVVACLPRTWRLVADHGVNSAGDRFRVLTLSTAMPGPAVATAIVERHLGGLYDEVGFTPPHPTWPVLPSAFEDPEVAHCTARRLLQRVERHVEECLRLGEVRELADFGEPQPVTTAVPTTGPDVLGALDEEFARLRAAADVVRPLDPAAEGERMPALLGAALRCYVLERGGAGQDLAVDPPSGVVPVLHARLRRTLDEEGEGEEHWSFRAIAHSHHSSVLPRLQSACLDAELWQEGGRRHLVVLRNIPFSAGPKTVAALAEFEAAGGVSLPVSQDDLRTFEALELMLARAPEGLLGWLAARLPASRSGLLRRVLPAPVPEVPPVPEPVPAPVEPSAPRWPEAEPGDDRSGRNEDGVPAITLGVNADNGRPFTIPVALLRKHTAVFAGTGSGKTVLLRRLVEEVALHGVSSVLIDTNNDLARLGDPWPSPPVEWGGGDAERARRYFADTDVVVWTPSRETGRPLVLTPLPDFGGVVDDPDEFRTAIDAAVAGLVPRAGLSGRKLDTGKAVLTEALAHFARRGGSDLKALVAFLGDLPEGVSTIRDSAKLAADIAEGLKAAMINDPVFGGLGDRLDPGVLLTPPPGRRARVSVISCVGLPNDDQRQTFVNQLQLALFAWVRRNPAGDRPLGGLLVLDEAQTFVPARGTPASRQSTLMLATQARKYGLGMVYATQAPKALHNQVTGNAATQFFGLLNASAQIDAAKALARAKGGRVDDISRLPAGRFYGATEGTGFAKLRLPMCLSHHPPSALTEDEVLRRARDGRDQSALAP
ncbi:ATP-binding protein [Saccharothrix syringae]|uniref:DUF87 domain-containing protein n=1 Tax=Saccharothrix syringae TaxID=103733 RepID=A0A5Q0H120_SACSY|nr:DUF87 domain-containing protein [Saccharothrix syringae]QFZ19372.1 DUF87 domain-containing protein [Saccharothrix syringae]